jgi:hypothetical protein
VAKSEVQGRDKLAELKRLLGDSRPTPNAANVVTRADALQNDFHADEEKFRQTRSDHVEMQAGIRDA